MTPAQKRVTLSAVEGPHGGYDLAVDPQSLLVSISGVLAIIALVWWAMGSAVVRIGNEDAARARIAWDHPDFVVGRLAISADGHDALALSADGREVVLLFSLGNRVTCWRQARQALHAERREDASSTTLVVTTGDFTLPSVRLTLTDSQLGRELAAQLGAA
jgi:hypothetical protein